jgi:hypothetical protein
VTARRARAIDAIMRAGPVPLSSESRRRIATETEDEKESYALCAFLVTALAIRQQESGKFPEPSAEQREEVEQSVRWLRPKQFAVIDRLVLDSMRTIERRKCELDED